MDSSALFKIGYGLYVLTSKENGKDNGCIINTLLQVTSGTVPSVVIAVNKQNLTHDMVKNSGTFNISMLTTDTPFDVFKNFGFQSGRNSDKFANCSDTKRSENGLIYLASHSNAYLSCKVTSTMDFDTHTMFVADILEGENLSSSESLTYSHYHQHIKPKTDKASSAKGYRCLICGFIYDKEPLPADYVCPLCKHGASDFEKIT